MTASLNFVTVTAAILSVPLASAQFTVMIAAVGGLVAGMFLTWALAGLVSLARDRSDQAARRKREAEYEELRRKYPDAAKAVDEIFEARLPSLASR